MGILLFRYLELLRENKVTRLLYGHLNLEDTRYDQGHLRGLTDVLNLCDTLDVTRLPTEEELKKLAEKRNPKSPSQAEVMGELRAAVRADD